MSSIDYIELGNKLYVTFTHNGEERRVLLPNNRDMKDSIQRVIDQQR
jgi:hypothetical protein